MAWGDVGEHFVDDLEDWAGPQECKIGLCKDRWNCENIQTCDIYSEAWCLPYYYDHGEKCLYVLLGQALGEIERQGFEDIAPNLIEEWNALGFAMSVALQWERKPEQLIVRWNTGEFHRPERIPYQYNFSVPSLIVWTAISEDAKKAGYAPAVNLCSVNELPW